MNQGIPESHILTAVRRCTKGLAQETLMHLSRTATLGDVMTRYDMVFGNIQPVQVLLCDFRLEDMVQKIRTKYPNSITVGVFQLTLNPNFSQSAVGNIQLAAENNVPTL